MIEQTIRWSVANRFLVLLATLFVVGWGLWAVRNTPIDALPRPRARAKTIADGHRSTRRADLHSSVHTGPCSGSRIDRAAGSSGGRCTRRRP